MKLPALLAGSALLLCERAAAHGFGQRYDLPVPLWLYLTGAGGTVAISFVLVAWFVRAPHGRRSVSGHAPPYSSGIVLPKLLVAASRLAVLLLYTLVVIAGFIGEQNAFKNVAPVMVWAIWWVGVAYLSALAGDVWAIVNPLATAFRCAEALYARRRPGRRLALGLAYPGALGVWPAVVLFLAFTWLELVWPDSDVPAPLACAMLAYAVLTWSGMLLFGRDKWLAHGEVFAIVFGLLARFAPIAICRQDGRIIARLRGFAVGLLCDKPADASLIVLVIAMLAAVSFDGFSETGVWAALTESAGSAAGLALATLGVVAAPVVFLLVYMVFCYWIARFGNRASTGRIAGRFVLTLVPIAIAYHLAHYLTFLVMAGQYLIPLASDPFGWKWDLFGGVNHFIRLGLVDARLVWYVSVAAIVAGHVAAVYLAHREALVEFEHRRAALKSQYPMVVLMVAYTMTSLWIIAQPIVTTR